jgi:two-component system LytT family sensor kinase
MAILENELHVIVTTGSSPAGDLIGYTTGLLITVLLLVLTLRAAKLPGTPLANIVFAVCALLWTAGGLAHAAFLASGMPDQSRLVLMARAVQFSGAGAFPIPILAIWRPFATLSWQKTAARCLHVFACFSAAAIAIFLWSGALGGAGPVPLDSLENFTGYNAALLCVLGAGISLRRSSTPRAVYLPSLAIVAAVCGASVTMTMAGAGLAFVGSHLVLLIVLCAFFLFARFRFADVFIRYGVRILLAGTWATILAFAAQSSFVFHLANRAPSPQAVHVFAIILVANALLLSFTFVDERIARILNRWLFRTSDYRTATRQLGITLGGLQLESEIAAAVEDAARGPLQLSSARIAALDNSPPANWPAAVIEGEIVELPLPEADVLIPITTAGRVTHVLRVTPGSARPGLVTHDLNYLRGIAALCGNRLDALRREREAIERQSRESLLLQQVTEAELRALRAQINPHFLFNSLNTIADLTVRDPARAEAMTLRLARAFRHVLAHSSRSLTSIREEVEFLRTYLYIEEARFGDRLRVEIDVAPEVAGEPIPSLILQPLVENALKHGLGPKPGPGRLWISAQAQGDQVCVRVEDDGMGLNGRLSGRQGLGLTNVAARLKTLYHDRASVSLEPRTEGGSRVTVLIPRGQAVNAA